MLQKLLSLSLLVVLTACNNNSPEKQSRWREWLEDPSQPIAPSAPGEPPLLQPGDELPGDGPAEPGTPPAAPQDPTPPGDSGGPVDDGGGAPSDGGDPAATELVHTIFGDQLAEGWHDMSVARLYRVASPTHGGGGALAVTPAGRLGVRLTTTQPLPLGGADTLELWVHGGLEGGQNLRLAALSGGVLGEGVRLGDLIAGGIPAGTWKQVRVSLAALGARGPTLDGLWLEDLSGGAQGTLYLDDIALVRLGSDAVPPAAATVPAATPAAGKIVVDPAADRRPVSQLVFGASFGSSTMVQKQEFPLRRWGGNHTSRYAWDVDASNRASDWYFESIPEANPNPAALPHGSAADRFVDETFAYGGEPLVTIPMLGFVPKDRVHRWSYSVAKYGSQTGKNGDAGNGIRSSGGHITSNDKLDASKAVGPDYVVDWLEHLAGRNGTVAEGGVRFVALDNEWTLWPETHRDVHPQTPTYAEMWDKAKAYGGALKALDPELETFAPMAYGWCGYLGTTGECTDGPDRRANGELIPWLLRQVCAHEAQTGVRLVDYLTVHYYPQGGMYSTDESAAMVEKRLRSVRSLYDASYVDESWVAQPVMLIPRLKKWVADNCPGTKLAITEYNWGSEDAPSGALAQAEVLAVFAREGLDLAAKWTAPIDGRRIEDAFTLYRNFDGAGSRVAGDSVRAASFDVDRVGAYAMRDGKRLYVMLFNKSTTVETVQVSVAGGVMGALKTYGFDAARRLGSRGDVAVSGGAATFNLPARSATLAVGTLP